MLDTRNGLGYTKTFEIQYEGLRKIGQAQDGLDQFIYFLKVPWIITKITWQYIEPLTFWEDKIDKMKKDYVDLSTKYSGEFIESVNVGERLIIDGHEVYAGSYTIANYGSGIGKFPTKYNFFEWSEGQISFSGYWDDNGKSALHGKSIFSNNNYGLSFYRSYSAKSPAEKIGDKVTISGIEGIVSSINNSNPRYIDTDLIYDYKIQINSLSGTKINA